MAENSSKPLTGLKVIEFTHMVMGPVVGAILAELGATVVKIEPPGGDPTRRLKGSGAGYFAMYNRNKRSVCLNVKDPEGLRVARRLIAGADVFVENFRPGALDEIGLGYDALAAENPRLIYCAATGFLSGPYQHRTALDEVVQMMAGLAYMTGPPGRPLRAGASIVDVTGGMFGVIGILAAVEQRHRTGRGGRISSALFETAVYLVGQHMAQQAVTGSAAPPMPVRVSAWAIYDVFECADGQQVFIGVVSDTLWGKFCRTFQLEELAADPELRTNEQRVQARDRLLSHIRSIVRTLTKDQLIGRLEGTGIPFAPIGRPEDLFFDPHLLSTGGLVAVDLPQNGTAHLPILPIELYGRRTAGETLLPLAGEHTRLVLEEAGFSKPEIESMQAKAVIVQG
jgi:crotonobetainyl-CoA:carnitine CoA-transferase CaiB-like acyl-CoA transferase